MIARAGGKKPVLKNFPLNEPNVARTAGGAGVRLLQLSHHNLPVSTPICLFMSSYVMYVMLTPGTTLQNSGMSPR